LFVTLGDLARWQQESGLICPSSTSLSWQGRSHFKKGDLGRLFLIILAFLGSSRPLPTQCPISLHKIAALFICYHFNSNIENKNAK